jgi:hypothetical protein
LSGILSPSYGERRLTTRAGVTEDNCSSNVGKFRSRYALATIESTEAEAKEITPHLKTDRVAERMDASLPHLCRRTENSLQTSLRVLPPDPADRMLATIQT